jgi:hypothetical protein
LAVAILPRLESTILPINRWKVCAKIVKVGITVDLVRFEELPGSDLTAALDSKVEVILFSPATTEEGWRIAAVHLITPSSLVRLDLIYDFILIFTFSNLFHSLG